MYTELFTKEHTYRDKVEIVAKQVLGDENAFVSRREDKEDADKYAQEHFGLHYDNGHGDVIYFMKDDELKDYLFLKWPVVEIRNRNDNKHILKDMYVVMGMSNKSFRGRLVGFRGILSPEEYLYDYAHSHLNGISPANFCTGRDVINDVWTNMKFETYDGNEENYFLMLESFIHFMSSFIAYESLEGVPYRRMTGISSHNQSYLSQNETSRELVKLADEMEKNNIELAMDFNSMSVNVVETDELHDEMASIVVHHQIRTPNGNYYDFGESPQDIDEYTGIYYRVGKQVKEIKVQKIKNEELNKSTKGYCHKSTSDNFFRRIRVKGAEVIGRIAENQWSESNQKKISESDNEGKRNTNAVSKIDLSNFVLLTEE